jgi:hypothetical protein
MLVHLSGFLSLKMPVYNQTTKIIENKEYSIKVSEGENDNIVISVKEQSKNRKEASIEISYKNFSEILTESTLEGVWLTRNKCFNLIIKNLIEEYNKINNITNGINLREVIFNSIVLMYRDNSPVVGLYEQSKFDNNILYMFTNNDGEIGLALDFSECEDDSEQAYPFVADYANVALNINPDTGAEFDKKDCDYDFIFYCKKINKVIKIKTELIGTTYFGKIDSSIEVLDDYMDIKEEVFKNYDNINNIAKAIINNNINGGIDSLFDDIF